jgi:hypothetical protein
MRSEGNSAALFYKSLPLLGYAGLFSRHSPLRGVVRGAHTTANLRARVRSLLPPDPAMVAEGTKINMKFQQVKNMSRSFFFEMT